MKEGWEYIALSSVCKVQNGFAFNSKLFNESNNGLPLIRIRDIKRGYSLTYTSEICSDEFFVEDGDMLIGMDGDFNIGEWKGGHALLNQRVCKLVPSEKILAKFIFYFIPEALQRINDKTAFSTVKHLSSKQVNAILLPNLPLSEQQSIVDYLDSAFAKINAMKANAEKALNEAKALFQASLKEMLEPKEGWEEKRIDEICTIARGGSPRPIKDFITNSPEGLNWIKIGDTDMGGKYIYSTKEKIKPEGLKKSRWVEVDEFLLSNSMSFGRPYILKTNGCIHDGWLVLRDYQKYLNIDFFYYVLSSENVQKQFRIKAQGSTVSNLNTDRVASVIIYVPTIERQQSIVATLDSLKSKVDRLQENYNKISQECDALKQAILRQVFE